MSADDQSRESAWGVLRWIDETWPDYVFIENVPAFMKWSPMGLNHKPIKSRRGETFLAYVAAIASRGYTVEYRLLNSANYRAATARPRLYIAARRDGAKKRGPIAWPAPTHAETGSVPLFADVQPWRGAREIIDWSDKGKSIFNRKKPLAENTMRRIAAGAKRFWGMDLEPFLIAMEHGGRVLDADSPLPVITTARGGAFGLVQPFVTKLRGTSPAHLASSAQGVDVPLGTVTASGEHYGLCEPFLIGQQSGATARPVSAPTPTVATCGAISLVEPFLVNFYGSGNGLIPQSIDRPLPTITTKDRFGLVQLMQLDILFRMLRPHELAAAMGFPSDYQFAGRQVDVVRQIGNAVEVNQAAALWAHPVEQVSRTRKAA